jgi:hypothetical protein
VMAAITTNIPYWNWYGFPVNYTSAYMFIEFMDYLVAGMVVSAILKPRVIASKPLAVAA